MQNKWWIPLLKGIVFIILGILSLIHPLNALLTLGAYIGYVSIFTGILYFIYYFTNKKEQEFTSWFLLEGLLDIVFGVVILSNPTRTAEVLPLLLGFWIILLGIVQISGGIALGKIYPKGKIWLLILGVLSIIFGFMIVNSPVISGMAITTMLGVFFLAYGGIQIYSSFKLKD